MDNSQSLIQLAKDPSHDARAELASKTANQLLNRTDEFSDNELKLFDDVFKHLYQFAPIKIKQELSSTLALADWAPQNILKELANDDFDVAGPVISFSPVIDDETLVQIINSKGEKHQSCIAGRSNIGEEITSALIATNTAGVVSALSNNKTASISAADFQHAIEIVKNNPNAIDNFAARTDLPADLVAKVFDLASPKAKAILHSRREKIDNSQKTATNVSSDSKVETVESHSQDQASGLSASQILALLLSNNKSAFIKNAALIIGVDADKLMNLISTDLLQNYGFIIRALGLERNAVAPMASIFSSRNHEISPENEKTIALMWMKYVPASAKIHIQTITANM